MPLQWILIFTSHKVRPCVDILRAFLLCLLVNPFHGKALRQSARPRFSLSIMLYLPMLRSREPFYRVSDCPFTTPGGSANKQTRPSSSYISKLVSLETQRWPTGIGSGSEMLRNECCSENGTSPPDAPVRGPQTGQPTNALNWGVPRLSAYCGLAPPAMFKQPLFRVFHNSSVSVT